MIQHREQLSPEEKCQILYRHLVDGIAPSKVCDQYAIHPADLKRWKKALCEADTLAGDKTNEKQTTSGNNDVGMASEDPSRKNKKIGRPSNRHRDRLALEAETIFQNSYDGLWIMNVAGEILAINPAAERINNLKATECVGQNIKHIASQYFIDASIFPEVIKKKTTVNIIQRNILGRKLLVTAIPIFDENNKIVRIVSNERDITEMDDLRLELEKSKSIKNRYKEHLKALQINALKGDQIIAKSPEMLKLFHKALKASEFDSTLLITGESGVGKGVMAKFIHDNSARNNKPMIELNCSAIPESLLEAELFGYEKGAFTGANAQGKPGYFELANEGTLFLDEIGELSLSSQSKLLRFLEDGKITRVGGTYVKQLNVRIIAATNSDLDAMLKERRFRPDLYHRLNVIRLHVAPLRNRRECILPLINHFIDYYSKEVKSDNKPRLSSEALDALFKYEYPGNVRELMNICERLIVMADGPTIYIDNLPSNVVYQLKDKSVNSKPIYNHMTLNELLKMEEEKILRQTMKRFANQSKAAEALGVTQPTIARKLKKFGIVSKY